MRNLIGEANWNALRPVLIWTFFILVPAAVFALFDYPVINWVIDHTWVKWTLFWVLFSLFSGWAEAFLIEALVRINGFSIPKEIHWLFNMVRFFVWLPIFFLMGWVGAGCCVLLFPFFHDGNYYRIRNKMNSAAYKNGWWSNPHPSSTALTDSFMFNWVRVLLFVGGMAILLISNRNDLW